jgi:protein-L-isoaspartate(D-aspartate) O-methyltransferase
VAAVRRESFVAAGTERGAGGDYPLRIPCGQTTSQPSLIALILQHLRLDGTERVLEVGTGLGYQAALLSELVVEVWTIEFFPALAEQARRNLRDRPNVQVVSGDGNAGLPEHAPYDAVLLAAATPTVPPALVEQLAEGGRLIAPVGVGGDERLVRWVRRGGRLTDRTDLGGVRYVPLLSREGGL